MSDNYFCGSTTTRLAGSRPSAFRLKTLVKRYEEARRVRAGLAWRFEQNFLVLVATLFGDDTADELEPKLKRD